MTRVSTFLLALLALASADLGAQRRQVSLELNPVHGTLGYGWTVAPTRFVGVELGFGFPQLDRTLAPAGGSLMDVLHVGAFVRSNPAKSLVLDGHVQAGFAELRGCSGCLPGMFTAVSGAAFLGGRHLKAGSRVTAGAIKENGDPASFVLNLTPVAVLLSYTW